MSRVRALACLVLAVGLALACNGEDASGSSAEAAPAESEQKAKAKRDERPLPAFSGWTLDDQRLDIATLIGKRLIVYFFDPMATAESAPVTEAVARVAKLRAEQNFEVVGVAVGSSRPKAKEFTAKHGVDFPVIDDESRRIAQLFGLDSPTALLGVDAEGYLLWGRVQFPTTVTDAVNVIEEQLRTDLRLPAKGEAAPGDRPIAPTFTAAMLDQKERFDLASTRGKPVLLLFFLHTCPH